MNWEIGIDIYTLICIKGITNKNLLYKKINKIQKLKKKKKANVQYLIRIFLLSFLHTPAIVSNTLLPHLSLLLTPVGESTW